ncbi:MAG: hypothetical protein NVS2B12_21910 [Ktedonobacteraceae bacterium]
MARSFGGLFPLPMYSDLPQVRFQHVYDRNVLALMAAADCAVLEKNISFMIYFFVRVT